MAASSSSSSSGSDGIQVPRTHLNDRTHNQFFVWREFLWGAIAGAFGEGMMHPIDTIKTRIQSQAIINGSQTQKSISQMVRTVWGADGLRGFYRGVTPGVTGSLATGATYFGIIESTKKWIEELHPDLGGHWAHFIAGGVGDTLGSFVYVPCEVMKQRMQIQGTRNSWSSIITKENVRQKSGMQMYGYYSGMFQAGGSIWKEHGVRGLYAGYWSTLARDVPFAGLMVTFYEALKELTEYGRRRWLPDSDYHVSSSFEGLLLGGLAGGFSAYLTTPLDVIKTRLQVQGPVIRPINRQKSLITIAELNRDGPYLGLITVYPPEEKAFFATGAFDPHPKHPFVNLSGRRFQVGKIHDKRVIYVRCGVGMRNAATATQQMLDLFDISGIVHFGIAGNANSSLSIGDVVIPKQFAHTGIWDWLKPKAILGKNKVAHLDFGKYNVPKGEETNLLGRISFSTEEYYSGSEQPNIPQNVVWAEITKRWLRLASNLEEMELERCLNSSLCLPSKPKLVISLKGSTSNIFVDNAAYREFLFKTFQVSSIDMESVAVVMTSLSNGFPVIVIRGLSDLAGGQAGQNSINVFGPLAALNTAKAVIRFVELLPSK